MKNSLKIAIKQAELFIEAARNSNEIEKQFMDSLINIQSFDTIIKNYIEKSKTLVSHINENYLTRLENLLIVPLREMYIYIYIYIYINILYILELYYFNILFIKIRLMKELI